VEAFPEADTIFEANIATLQRLGATGWAALEVGPRGIQAQPPTAKS
jgi:hypothetical protein